MTGAARDKRLWLGGGVALLAVVALATWFLLIGPKLTETRDLRDQTESVRSENAALAAGTASLRERYAHLPGLKADASAALAALPPESGLPQLNRQLALQAERSGVVLDSIQVAASTTTSATAGADPATGEAGPVAPPGTVAIPVTLLSRGPAAQQRQFLRAIQVDGPRRALVTSTSLTAAEKTSVDVRSSMTTQITVFTAPLSAAQRTQLAKLLHGAPQQ